LVKEWIDDGKAFVERLVTAGTPVAAAFWVKESENGRWYLYVATPLVPREGGTREAYRRIVAAYREMPEAFSIGPLQIRAVAPSSPVGGAVLDLQKRHPGKGPIRYGDGLLGNVPAEATYIYRPTPTPVP
jgi:hypothetical protein